MLVIYFVFFYLKYIRCIGCKRCSQQGDRETELYGLKRPVSCFLLRVSLGYIELVNYAYEANFPNIYFQIINQPKI